MPDLFDGSHWMGSIPGDSLLSALSIPGTHESCARYGGVAFECQTWPLIQQLEYGIRFLDIRCRHYKDRFPIHHSLVYEHLDFGPGVMQICIDFLKANPRECIVMSIKKEYDDADNTQSFQDTFESYIGNVTDFWYLDDIVPTLDQVRGKIVLIRRFQPDSTPLGIDATNWPDNQTFVTPIDNGSLAIEDNYYIWWTVASMSGKWTAVSDHISSAVSSGDSSTWFITFCSGSGAIEPANLAKGTLGYAGINEKLKEFLPTLLPGSRVGTILLDYPEYPDTTLIEAVANFNSFLPLDHRRIECIRKPDHTDKRHAIRWLAGTEYPSGQAFQMLATDCIQAIESGARFIVVGTDGSEAAVQVYSHQEPWETSPQRYLATVPDSSKEDNLLALPECPGGGLDSVFQNG